MNKQLLAMLVLLTAVSGPAQSAELAGNVGFMSDYIFRGVKLSSSSANGGVDLTEGAWYVGTWLADVDTSFASGIEIDLYGGWAGQTDKWSYGIGTTAYFYTDNQLDNNYFELNLSGGYDLFTLDIAIGQYDTTPRQDYTFVSGTFEKAGFHGIIGVWFQDFDGYYFDFGYGNTLAVKDVELFDWTISLLSSHDIENQQCNSTNACTLGDDVSIFLDITRSFGIWSSK